MKGEALAEYIAVKKASIYKKPENVSFETAAAILTGGTTATYLLNKSKVKAGDEILINGASGGVGMIALQLAKIKVPVFFFVILQNIRKILTALFFSTNPSF
jgi:NADPH:quinone reductase-like Zn-dependent oxidoreductase